jgi:hypothetical protein
MLMEDRIQINGVWYKREEESQSDATVLVPLNREDVTACKTLTHETKDFCFTAIKLEKDGPFEEGEFYDDIDLEFTDKRVKPWKEELWDNMNWIRGVLQDNPESIKHLYTENNMTESDVSKLRSFLLFLSMRGWL